MSTRSLLDAVIDPGIRNPNYFEGRLLTADALRDDQRVQRERQRLLGRAIGAGVVEGLTVEALPAAPGAARRTVKVSKGYAINTEGDTLWLQEDLVADVVPPIAVPEAPATLFARCKDAATPTPGVPVGVGLYVLVVYPATGYRERAAKSGLGSEGKIIGCGDRYAVDGVRFRLERLDPQTISGASLALKAELTSLLNQTSDAAKRSLLRNLAAHLCFGTPELAQFPVDPFAHEDGASTLLNYGAIDDLRGLKRITDCDVPLALLLWDATGIAFVDLWAVRRRPVAPAGATDWSVLAQARAAAESDARWLQFQAHLQALVDTETVPALIAAQTHFRYLPPAGLLPLSDTARPRGVTVPGFFAGRTCRTPVFLEGARLAPVFAAARGFPPVDLTEDDMTWVYLMRENRQPVPPASAPPAAAAALFTSGHLPFFGDARLDVNRWNYSNFGSLRVR
jgi:hypothetical protein